MIDYEPIDEFTSTDIYDLTDLVLGGVNGVSNTPIKALLNQTKYLMNRLGRVEDVKEISGDYTWDIADLRKAFKVTITNNAVFNLPNVTTVPKGYILPIRTRYSAVKAVTVRCNGSQKIDDGFADVSEMHMHTGERLWLVAAGTGSTPDHWEAFVTDGNFFTAGEGFGARKQMPNTFLLNGGLFNRADTPRLSSFAASLSDGEAIVDDIVWGSDPGGRPVYRGCFSKGNGSTTYRLPDERGLTDRYLDLGRGIDNGRTHNYAGGFEDNSVQEHDHPASDTDTAIYFIKRKVGGPGGGLGVNNVGSGWELAGRTTGKNTGSETRSKNIGKIPLIRY